MPEVKLHKLKNNSVVRIAGSFILLLLMTGAMCLTSCSYPAERTAGSQDGIIRTADGLSRDGYELEKVVILSRHNIRSPLVDKDSLLGSITPHEWFDWTSGPAELSLRGGMQETALGQFFRNWVEDEGLLNANYIPEGDEIRFYANSKQRTIATAEYFSAGFLPVAGIPIEYHMEFDKMDPVFTPQLTFATEKYKEDAVNQIEELYMDDISSLKGNFDLLSEVLDIEDSAARKSGSVGELVPEDVEFILEKDAEPGLKGSLKTATSASDALVLQYYEEKNPLKAAFGHRLDIKQWEDISRIKDVYGDVLFTAPLIAANVAHPLLQEINNELCDGDRKFTFLCGHDSNVGSVLAALDTEEYFLPDTIEKKTPIGCKLVFGKWRDKDGKEFISMDLVYLTTRQLRNINVLGSDNPPDVFPLELKGIPAGDDGLYPSEDFMERLKDAIDLYDCLYEEYCGENAA
ncbi:MAG: histidine-type phosphatase [Lachnospiraceae bacterium]|nr:histidine-type phosphatase [Lachnospiraceae bacterium]